MPDTPQLKATPELEEYLKNRGLEGALNVLVEKGYTNLHLLADLAGDPKEMAAVEQDLKGPVQKYWRGKLNAENIQQWQAKKGAAASFVSDEAERHTAEREKRKAELQSAMSEVDELRKKVQTQADTLSEKQQKEVQGQLEEIRKRLLQQHIELPELDLSGGLNKQLNALRAQMTAASKELFDVAEKKTLSVADLIYNNRLLYGRLVDAAGISNESPSGGALVKLPSDNSLGQMLSNYQGEARNQRFELTSEKSATATRDTVTSSGSTFTTSTTFTGVAVIGSGLGAVSAAVDYSRTGREETGRATAEQVASAFHCVQEYCFLPKKRLDFDTRSLVFATGAADEIKRLTKVKPAEERRSPILEFFHTYGSHFFPRCTLGGLYMFQATGRTTDVQKRESLRGAVAAKIDLKVAAAVKGAGLSFAFQLGHSDSYQSNQEEGSHDQKGSREHDQNIQETTLSKGGVAGLSYELWRVTMEYNQNWVMLDFGHPSSAVAVWDLLRQSGDQDFRDVANEFETVWVQDVFLESLFKINQRCAFEFRDKDKVPKTSKDLGQLERMLTLPQLNVDVFKSEDSVKGSRQSVIVRVPRDYKVIGGGASVVSPGCLTASYPGEQGTWCAEARLPGKEIDDSVRVNAWAVAIHDPFDLWEVHIANAKSPKEDHPAITARLPQGFVLTGGGSHAASNGMGNFLTVSHPAVGLDGWTAKSKDTQGHGDPAELTAYAIGVKSRDLSPEMKVFWQQTNKTDNTDKKRTVEVTVDKEYTLVGGGALAEWNTNADPDGTLLQASRPDGTGQTWTAEANKASGSLTAYAIGIRTR